MRTFVLGLIALCVPGWVSAEAFDWHSAANQRAMHKGFVGAARTCVGAFGFTPIDPLPESTAIDKLDAYLLLKGSPFADLAVEQWALNIVEPIAAILRSKSGEATVADDKRAAAAAVAASEDPDVFEEAKTQFVESAMAPFRKALDACKAGASDPFLGKYYWTGNGSAEKYEAEFSGWFSEFVDDLKKKKTTKRH